MAFGSGVLISAVAFDLMAEAAEVGGLGATASGFLGGAVVYLAQPCAGPAWGPAPQALRRPQPSEDEQSGSGAAIAVAPSSTASPSRWCSASACWAAAR